MVEIHETLSRMISLYSLLMAGWSLFKYFRKNPPDGNFNGALVLAVVLYAVEGVTGVLLYLMGYRAGRSEVHWLYGATILLTVPAIYLLTRGRNSTRESLLYGLGFLFIWGLSERAQLTGYGDG